MSHLVIMPLPAQGHMVPALVLAHRLVRTGYKVTYVCYEFRFEQIQREAKARGCDEGISFKLLRVGSPLVSSTGHDTMEMLLRCCFSTEGDAVEFKGLLEELMNCGDVPPCCIITDNLVASWAQDVANEFRLPRLVVYPSPALALAVVFHLRNLLQQEQLPIKTDPREPQLVRIPGMEGSSLSPLRPTEVSSPLWDTGSQEMLEFYINNAVRIHDAAGILCNTFTELEPDACDALMNSSELNPNKVPFLAVGPILPDSYVEAGDDTLPLPETAGKEAEECLKWLDEQPARSVIFISFGSFATASDEQFEKLALGIEASSKRFLWVVPGGRGKLPAGFMERAGNRGMVLQNWAPQLQVLSHVAVAGFLTHCGWNSTMESVCRGVPMLTMPHYGEQQGNAKIIVDYLGIGLQVRETAADLAQSDTVERAVRKVVDHGEILRNKAAALRLSAQTAAKNSSMKMKEFIDKIVENWRTAT